MFFVSEFFLFVEGVFSLGCVCIFFIWLCFPWPHRHSQGNVHLPELTLEGIELEEVLIKIFKILPLFN